MAKETIEANLDKVYDAIVRATKDIAVDRFVLWAGLGGGTEKLCKAAGIGLRP